MPDNACGLRAMSICNTTFADGRNDKYDVSYVCYVSSVSHPIPLIPHVFRNNVPVVWRLPCVLVGLSLKKKFLKEPREGKIEKHTYTITQLNNLSASLCG